MDEIKKEVLDQFPDNDAILYPHQIGLRISNEAFSKIEKLKKLGKKKADLLRQAIDKHLEDVSA